MQFQALAATAKQLRERLQSAEVEDDVVELCHEIETNQQRKLQLVRLW
jgi:hypothetical protein